MIESMMKDAIKPFNIAKSLTQEEWINAITQPPREVIGSNSKLAKTDFWQWTIPALTAAVVIRGKLVDGYKTCPMAGECARLCYACQGGYVFKSSMVAHTRNLQAYFDDPMDLADRIVKDIASKRKLRAFRIHDSGDFFNKTYALWWIGIVNRLPNVQFYAYTKQVKMFKETLAEVIPTNLTLIYSFGGKQDDLIDPATDRHSKVWPEKSAMLAAGYADTTDTDEHAANPDIKNIGLVYHGVLGVDKAFSNASMGTNKSPQKEIAA